MKINEIKRGMSNISVTGEVTDKSERRRVRTRFGSRNVCDAILEDETGRIKISLWEEQTDTVNVGDKGKIIGAYITEYRNRLQLNIPRSGRLEITEENILEI